MTTVSVYDGVSVYLVDPKVQNSTFQPAQDFVLIGGQKSPGLAIVKNIKAPRGWDKREGYGFSGASVIFIGARLATFDIEFQLWTDEHWRAWPAFAALLAEPRGLAPTLDKTGNTTTVGSTSGLNIFHPLLFNLPISVQSAVVTSVDGFEQDDEGLWSCTVSFLEFRPPQKALSKPVDSIPSASKPEPTAKTQEDIEIAAKRAQLANLAAGR